MNKKYFNDIYYDILAFYYWQPQDLGKKKNPTVANLEKIAKALGVSTDELLK